MQNRRNSFVYICTFWKMLVLSWVCSVVNSIENDAVCGGVLGLHGVCWC